MLLVLKEDKAGVDFTALLIMGMTIPSHITIKLISETHFQEEATISSHFTESESFDESLLNATQKPLQICQ